MSITKGQSGRSDGSRIRLVRMAVAAAIFLVGIAFGHFLGRIAPSTDWIFGQFADRIVLVERMRSGDRAGYDQFAIPAIETMVLQLHDRGMLGKSADALTRGYAKRALQVIRATDEARRVDKSLHAEVDSILEETIQGGQ